MEKKTQDEKKTEDKSRVNDNYHPVSRIFSLLPANVVFLWSVFFSFIFSVWSSKYASVYASLRKIWWNVE